MNMVNRHFFNSALTLLFALLIPLLFSSCLQAARIQVAVASNFSGPLKYLARQFEQHTSHKIIVISGSSGKLYAQIIHGAPYDAFFSADHRRPKLLEQNNLALKNTRFTYAIGKLILWSPDPNLINHSSEVLFSRSFQHIAMANPRLAPYGLAAKQVLQKLELWESLKNKMVRGENIGQAFQFVKSGNTPLGFVARSQVVTPSRPLTGSLWEIPDSYYTPIQQQAVQLKDNPVSYEFLAFVQSQAAQKTIQSFGYGISHAQ